VNKYYYGSFYNLYLFGKNLHEKQQILTFDVGSKQVGHSVSEYHKAPLNRQIGGMLAMGEYRKRLIFGGDNFEAASLAAIDAREWRRCTGRMKGIESRGLILTHQFAALVHCHGFSLSE
jgi:hypothetical protein